MKNEFLLRWLLMSEMLRWLTLLGLLVAVTLTVSSLWITPVEAQLRQLQQETRQQQRHYRQRLTHLLNQSGLQQLQARNQQLLDEMVREGRPFSLYTLLQHSGSELDQWMPGDRESLLQLWLSWAQLKALFAYLIACEPAPTLNAFNVQRKEARLYATFHLAFDKPASLD
jgi:pilus assembly protein HofO